MKLTVLSYGGGQDSFAILTRLIRDAEFRARYAPDQLIVIMSDTGDEHPHTLAHLKVAKELCAKNNIPFFHLTNDKGFHRPSWPDLITPQKRKDGGKFRASFALLRQKSCTDQLKLGPIYKFLDEYLNERMGYGFKVSAKNRGCGKQAIKRFAQENGNIQVLIGFAAGEESRSAKAKKLNKGGFWSHIERQFPLQDYGMDRATCQQYIASQGFHVPMPSNCMRCPYMSMEELLWLHLHHEDKYNEWVEIERNKLDRDLREGKEKSLGIFQTKETIPEKLAKVKAKYAHMAQEELLAFLNDWKLNHGCGSSSY